MSGHKIGRIVITAISIGFLFMYSPGTAGSRQVTEKKIRVGVYAGSGVGEGETSPEEYARDILLIIQAIDPSCTARLVFPRDIAHNVLKSLDVLVVPGGNSTLLSHGLGRRGRSRVQAFVREGGGYVGICAGAYLAQPGGNHPAFGLGLAPVRLYRDGRNWDRGCALARVQLTEKGRTLFPELQTRPFLLMHYVNGPVFVPLGGSHKNAYEEIMTFESDIAPANPRAKGETPGKAFLLRARKGRGTTVLVSGHPEFTPGFRWVLPRMIRWAARREFIPYPPKCINPTKYEDAIFLTGEWLKKEERLLAILSTRENRSAGDILEALEKLRDMGSRRVCWRLSSLLRHSSPEVRRQAAAEIMFHDYYPARDRLEAAMAVEQDPDAFEAMRRARTFLMPEVPGKRVRSSKK